MPTALRDAGEALTSSLGQNPVKPPPGRPAGATETNKTAYPQKI